MLGVGRGLDSPVFFCPSGTLPGIFKGQYGYKVPQAGYW